MANPIEVLKREKHGFDVWPDVLHHARAKTPMKDIPTPDLERMKWYGVFYRKRDTPGSYMLRIRITANELTAAAAKEIARIAYDYGYGIVDITTRANIQVQGLDIDQVPRALERLAAVGLTTKQTGLDNVRNVFGHPLSGIDPDELIDTRPLCREITSIFLDHRDYSDLPRKFNIALCGRAEHAIHYWTQDLAFLAVRDGGRIGFRVAIGGKQGQTPQLGRVLPIFVPPAAVVPVTGAILDLFREQGSRDKRDAARFHYLIENIGVAGVLQEIDRRVAASCERCDTQLAPPSGYDEVVGWIRQPPIDNIPASRAVPGPDSAPYWALGLRPALGRMSWMQLEGVGLAAERWADGRLRTTPEQGIVILDVADSDRNGLGTQLAHWNLCVHVDSRTRNVMACTGKQFCNIAVTETKAHALQLIEQLRQRSLELHGIHIHMSGCPSACANHHTADIGLKGVRVKRLLGTREGFDVLLGGGVAGTLQLGLPYRTGVDVHQLPNLVEEVVREYYLHHVPGQSFSNYWRDKLARAQESAVGESDYCPPVWECDQCGHRHSGDDPPVFCPQCTALRRHFARLESDAVSGATPVGVRPSLRDGARGPIRDVQVNEDGFAVAADASAVRDGRGLLVRLGGMEIALFRVGEKVVAIDNACPHAGGPLAEGTLDGSCVICPLHGWKFDVCTGGGVAPTSASVAKYPTKIENGKVLVHVAESGVPA